MKKTMPIALALMAGGLLVPLTAAAQDRHEVDEAIATLSEVDSRIHSFFANSEGHAIFPDVAKSASLTETPLGMFTEPSLSSRDVAVEWSDWSDEKKLLVVIAIGVGLLLIL